MARAITKLERGKNMPRSILKQARKDKGLTQQAVADILDIGLRHYQKIEYAELNGSYDAWDVLEDIFGVHQRKLREISSIHRGQAENLLGHPKYLQPTQ